MTATDRFQRGVLVARWLLVAQAVLLLLVSIWFRVRSLGNVPGFNGDEAWYGARVLDFLVTGEFPWRTLTGNPVNPFFLAPQIVLGALFAPSIALLRSVAVASGLAALAANSFLARLVFGRLTAVISTVALAALPVTIAYSRFAWDSCQTPLAVLVVFYLALASVKFPERRGRYLLLAILAEVAAFLVHPTNIFAAAVIMAAVSARWTPEELKQVIVNCFTDRRILAGLILAVLVVGATAWKWSQTTGPATVADRFVGGRDLAERRGLAAFVTLYPRLILGTTTVEYIAGSSMWCRWPCPVASTKLGVDTVVFWLALAASVGALWRSWRTAQRWEDRTLLSAWGLALATFLLVAGPAGMSPHYERYGLVLVVPSVLVLVRGLVLACEHFRALAPAMLWAASIAGWFLLADFDLHYFRFLTETGGRSHLALRTAAVEPKEAALAAILARSGGENVCIATNEYWLQWPLRYLAGRTRGVEVIPAKEGSDAACWRVEFVGSKAQRKLHKQQPKSRELLIPDAAGKPLIAIYSPVPDKGDSPQDPASAPE